MIARLLVLSFLLLPGSASAGWLESGLEALAGRMGVHADIGDIERLPGGGVRLRRVKLSAEGLSASSPEIALRLDWKALTRRRVELASVSVPELTFTVDGSPKRRPAAEASAWTVAARSVKLGRVRGVWKNKAGSREIALDEVELSYAADRLDVRGARVNLGVTTAAVAGWALSDGTAADLRASFSGRLSGDLRFARSAPGWTVRGRPAWDGLPLDADLALSPDGDWTAVVSAVDAGKLAPPWVRRLGAVRGRASASGRGFGADARGVARLELTSEKGPTARASARWSEATQFAGATLTGMGLDGAFTWNGSSGAWSLRGDGVDLAPLGLALAASSASSKGTFERGASGWTLDGKAAARKLRSGKLAADAFTLSVAGSTRSHTVVATAETWGTTVTAAARGRATPRGWASNWKLSEAGGAAKTARGEAAILYGDGRLEASGALHDLALTRLPASTAAPLGLAGALDASFSVAGPPAALVGRASWTVTGMNVASVGPGSLRGEALVSSNTVVLREARWDAQGAWAQASGSAPRPSSLAIPDFDLLLTVGGMDEHPQTVRLEWLEADAVAVGARMRLRRRDGRLSSEGVASARASALRLPPWGVSVTAASAAVTADGESFRVSGGALGRKNDALTAGGAIGLAGPDLTLKTPRLSFSPRPGVTVVAALDFALAGSWKAPRLTGEVRVERADLGPAPRPGFFRRWTNRLLGRKPAPPPPPAATGIPANLTADVKLSFDRQVWYKEGATSVELKGALRLRQEPPGGPQIFGRVETLRGRVAYYGRTFELQPSRVEFVGRWPADPELDAHALYVEARSRTRILLALTGPLSAPRAALSSEPPLEERDILSVLALGRPLEDRPEAGEASAGRQAAERLMAAYASQSVRENLLGRLELDVFQFTLDQERRSHLTVGRYVSRKLFVTVDQSFGAGNQSAVKAEYTLTPSWSLEFSRTNLGHGVMDLFYQTGFR